MRRLSIFLFFLYACGSMSAQEVLDLTGSWDFAVGDSAVYQDFVQLPGSMATNGKGEQTERIWLQRRTSVMLRSFWSTQVQRPQSS